MAIKGMEKRRQYTKISDNSFDSPLFDMANTTSPAVTMPKSPWLASPGCRKNDGVPVDARVAAIFLAI